MSLEGGLSVSGFSVCTDASMWFRPKPKTTLHQNPGCLPAAHTHTHTHTHTSDKKPVAVYCCAHGHIENTYIVNAYTQVASKPSKTVTNRYTHTGDKQTVTVDCCAHGRGLLR